MTTYTDYTGDDRPHMRRRWLATAARRPDGSGYEARVHTIYADGLRVTLWAGVRASRTEARAHAKAITAHWRRQGGETHPALPAVTYTASSIDGHVPFTADELRTGVGTDWSDDRPIPVFRDDEEICGHIDPLTGQYTSTD